LTILSCGKWNKPPTHKQKIDRTIESYHQKGIASGEIREEHFEKAPNGDSWFRLADQEGVPIVYN